MDVLVAGVAEAWQLLRSGDAATWQITWLTLRVSVTGTLVALVLGVPIGTLVALRMFPGRRLVLAAANTGMGLTPVAAGLIVTVFLWRSGPLGAFGLLYTPTAMVIAQAAIATPVIVALVASALQQIDPDFRIQMEALGATPARALGALLVEARLPLLVAADEAAALAGRAMVLIAGEVRQLGRTPEVLDWPVDVDCARLVGFTNVLPPSLTGLGTTVVARPEHTTVACPGRDVPAGSISIEGRLRRIVPLGGVTRLDVVLRDDNAQVTCLMTGEPGNGLSAPAPGAGVIVAVPAAATRQLSHELP